MLPKAYRRAYDRRVAALGNLSSPEIAGAQRTLMVPLGSTEQHGPHLPLDTDTRIAAAVAGEAAQMLGHLLAPAIAYGASGEHHGFPGTVSIGTEVLTAVLVEYGRSACDWAERLVFVNGHGGNVGALRAAVALLRTEGRDAAWLSCTATAADAHAGRTETSVLLHLSPEDVRTAALLPGNCEPLADLLPRLRAGGMRAVSASGVLGDPTAASAAEGERLFVEMVDDCVSRVRRWRPRTEGMLG